VPGHDQAVGGREAPVNAIRHPAPCLPVSLPLCVGTDFRQDILPALRRPSVTGHDFDDLKSSARPAGFFFVTRLDPTHPWRLCQNVPSHHGPQTAPCAGPICGVAAQLICFADISRALPTSGLPQFYRVPVHSNAPNEHVPEIPQPRCAAVMAGLIWDNFAQVPNADAIT